ncbi:GATA type DNA binding domain fused to an AT hook [Cryptosporidium canis]|nr:GATA type DNA binding domain fused to an AT hook [Cryptosporidium canis]
MKSQAGPSQRINGGSINSLPLIENVIQTKDERLVKRSNILPNLVSCDLISDDQSLIGSRTLTGDSQCLESYPFMNNAGQPSIGNTILGEQVMMGSARNIAGDNNGEGVIFGFKSNRYFETDIQSLKSMDSKLKQTNERRAGRPPLDRSDYFCQICSATKTPQWRYISVCSVESKLRVCNACWMKQRKKRDGKCLPIQLGMSNGLNCSGIGGILKTSKIGVNKENYEPQRQSYAREINGIGYKMGGIVGKPPIINDRSTIINSGVSADGKAASRELADNLNNYVSNESLKNKTGCGASNIAASGGQCAKSTSLRSSPYSMGTGNACQNSIFDCQTCGSNRCYCSSLIVPSGVSLNSVMTSNITECPGKLISGQNKGQQYSFNVSDKIPSIDICGQSNASRISYNDTNDSILDLGSQCIRNICIDDSKLTETNIDEGNNLENFPIVEKPIFDLNCGMDHTESNVGSGIEEPYVSNCLNVVSNSAEESPINSIQQSPKQNSNTDSYPSRATGKVGNGFISRKCSDSRNNSISNKISVSTPVHHQTSTTVSPNTNYCNISSYTSSPCQSFSTYDGPFLEDPNKTMYISSGAYFNSDASRWSEDTPVQSSMDLGSCVGNSTNTDSGEKIEPLPFPLDQDTHSSTLSQSNEQIDNEQVNYGLFNKHLATTESWNSDYLHIDMFSIPSADKTTLNSETSTSVHSFSISSKFFSSSVSCNIPAVYSPGAHRDDENSSPNDCNSWDFDSSSISCIDTWQNPLWYDSYSNGYCKLS